MASATLKGLKDEAEVVLRKIKFSLWIAVPAPARVCSLIAGHPDSLSCGLQTSDWDLYHWLPWFSSLRNDTIGFPGAPDQRS